MIEGWNIKDGSTMVGSIARDTLIKLEAEPNFAEIGEKVRELTADLHEKILNQEIQWSLMMTPLRLVRDLQRMCEGEITRREAEYEELRKDEDHAE